MSAAYVKIDCSTLGDSNPLAPSEVAPLDSYNTEDPVKIDARVGAQPTAGLLAAEALLHAPASAEHDDVAGRDDNVTETTNVDTLEPKIVLDMHDSISVAIVQRNVTSRMTSADLIEQGPGDANDVAQGICDDQDGRCT